jgi:hypothetical protein
MPRSESARKWLRNNGYCDVADLIDQVITEWAAVGKRTRRNWWHVLAGRRGGAPCVYAGRTFPVLRTAQMRCGVPVTDNAVARSESETVPSVWETSRWPRS